MPVIIESPTKAKITDIRVLSQKNRKPGELPGAQIALSMLLPNRDLAMIDGGMKSALYERSEASSSADQDELDGFEAVSDAPNLTSFGRKIGRFKIAHEGSGYPLVIVQGLAGEKSDITIDAGVISAFKLDPKEGGSVGFDFKFESQDVGQATFGKLASLKNIEVEITLMPPEAVQNEINPMPFDNPEEPRLTAGDIFANTHSD